MNRPTTIQRGTQIIGLLGQWPLLRLSAKAQFAIKVAVSLTLSYMIPMAMGWPQPSTAATTVMLIAATGGVRDSLMKGTLRIAGTVIGAVIGLTLIALFAQDRLLYLLSVSTTVTITLYLYKAYQGDGTLFMLAAVTMLMVFNGGKVEDAFLYGLDRAYMTTFGVAVYTLVGSFLWPVHAERNLAEKTVSMFELDQSLFKHLHAAPPLTGPDSLETGSGATVAMSTSPRTLIEQLASAESTLREQWLKARNEDPEVNSWSREWGYLLHYQRQLSSALAAAQQPKHRQQPDYARHITRHDDRVLALEQGFDYLLACWRGEEQPVSPAYDDALFREVDAGAKGHRQQPGSGQQ